MPYREFRKNNSETVRVEPKRYLGYDTIDIRIFARLRDGDVVPTKKGISLNVDQIPDLIEYVLWALQQPCIEDPSIEPAPPIAQEDAAELASYVHGVLARHGMAVHWDIAENMIFDNPSMRRFTKWHLHYVLVTRSDLFCHAGAGCFRAI